MSRKTLAVSLTAVLAIALPGMAMASPKEKKTAANPAARQKAPIDESEKATRQAKKDKTAKESGACHNMDAQAKQLLGQERQLHQQAKQQEAQEVSLRREAKQVEEQIESMERSRRGTKKDVAFESEVKSLEQKRYTLERQAKEISAQRAQVEHQAHGIVEQRHTLEEQRKQECGRVRKSVG